MRIAIFLIVLAFAYLAEGAAGQEYTPERGGIAFESIEQDWVDAERDRTMPVRLYVPAVAEPAPVVLLSHGLGGSRNVARFVAEHWASRGYLVVALQHPGSDASVWQDEPVADRSEALRRATGPRQFRNRVQDVGFALDHLAVLNQTPGPLEGRANLDHIAMAGHSFGAVTSQAMIGVRYGSDRVSRSLRDDRLDAAILFSPSVPDLATDLDKTFADVRVPVFHLTGTEDVVAEGFGPQDAATRRLPFQHMAGIEQYLLVFDGGDHMVFSGARGRRPGGENDELFHRLICQGTTAFLDSMLRGDESARSWLNTRFPDTLREADQFVAKQPE
jgi:predicted dienelactone hydrolase